MKISSRFIVSDWYRHERDIITGCAISAIFFTLVINMVKSAEIECLMKRGVRQPPINAYMDDLIITTSLVTGSRWILYRLEKLIPWARMNFKPAKSRSYVMKKGKVADNFRFSISGTNITMLTERPDEKPGKFFNSSLKRYLYHPSDDL